MPGDKPAMNWASPDLSKEFSRFRQHCEFTFKGPLSEKNETQKVNYLMTYMGDKGREIYSTFKWTPAVPANGDVPAQPAENETLEGVLAKFEAYTKPKGNEIRATVEFNNRIQRDGETFNNFLTDMRVLVKACGFKEEDRMLRDAIVLRSKHARVQERCLEEGDELTLAKAIQIGLTHETSQTSLSAMSNDKPVDMVRSQRRSQKTGGHNNKHRPTNGKKCQRCGTTHPPKSCPAWGKKCNKCHGLNHWAKCCRTKSVQTVSESDEEIDLLLDTVELELNTVHDDTDWVLTMTIGGVEVPFKLDTGAQVNILPANFYRKLIDKPPLDRSDVKIRGYSGTIIPIDGSCTTKVAYKGRNAKLSFLVTTIDASSTKQHQPVLGLTACQQLQLIKAAWNVDMDDLHTHRIVDQYKNVFIGLGCMPTEHKVHVDTSVAPVQHACRKIPFKLRENVKKELDRMEKIGVIEKQEEPTDWVSSLVTVKKKNGDIRVCLDPRDLNRAIKREHFKLPSREEIMAEFAGAKVFSKLDASSGFWQIKLDKESSKLTCFITPYGRYVYRRLPFGLNMAPEAYHQRVHRLFEKIDGVNTMMDDIIVWGSTQNEHDQRLKQVLDTAQKANLKLNRKKCEFGVNKLIFLGDLITDKGIRPDPSKVRAINNMERPTDKQALQRFLGMANYLAKFLPELSVKTAPLRQLLIDKNDWVWLEAQEKAWLNVKSALTSSPVLTFYDPAKICKISADASKDGIGAVLLQQRHNNDWAPVAYASRSMTDAEIRYAQIEKECLALTFACERFHQFLFGQKVIAETDHKPLISIFKKPLADSPLRLQRMRIRLQKYDLNLTYTPGKELWAADALSRAVDKTTVAEEDQHLEDDIEAYINMILTSLPVAPNQMQNIKTATEGDATLTQLRQTILEGWPEKRKQCPSNITEFWNYRDELSVSCGIIFKGRRVVIPVCLQRLMLHKIHEGHLGREKCKRRAREVLYWPNINKEIDQMIEKCSTCIKYRERQSTEPLQQHKLASRPWEKVGADLFELNNKDYIVVVDYYSQYIEMATLTNTTSKNVIKNIKSIFARHGTAIELISDNGPQFASREFREFAELWNFKHTTSSPHHPASNGQAENAVKIVKTMIRKVKDSSEDLHLALQVYRSTPLEHGVSPAELLFNRKIKSNLPINPTLLKPKIVETQSLKKKTMQLKQRQKKNFDKKSTQKAMEPLQVGDTVRVQNMDKPTASRPLWAKTGIVTKILPNRSYIVKTETGELIRRNRKHLLKTQPTTETEEEEEDEQQNQSKAQKQKSHSEASNTTTTLRRSDRIPKPNPKYFNKSYRT